LFLPHDNPNLLTGLLLRYCVQTLFPLFAEEIRTLFEGEYIARFPTSKRIVQQTYRWEVYAPISPPKGVCRMTQSSMSETASSLTLWRFRPLVVSLLCLMQVAAMMTVSGEHYRS
jgi:hypothetical protein